MKKFTAIISVVIVVSAAWFYLEHHYDNKTVNVWQLVHKNSLLVYESERAPSAWNDFISLPAWKILSTIPAFDSLNNQLEYLDSITGKQGEIENLLRDRNFLLSVNRVSTDRLDYVIFLTINNNEKHRILSEILNRLKLNPALSFSSRNYENTDLFEIKNNIAHTIFTYFIHKNYFIGSFTPYLVEDVVRNTANDYRSGFLQQYGSVLNFPTIKGDEGNLYLNPHELPSLVTAFTDPSAGETFKNLSLFSGAGYYDISFEKNRFLLNGTTASSGDTTATFLSTLTDQLPSEISCFNVMPSNTAFMFDFTFEDFSKWRKATDQFWIRNKDPQMNRKTAFFQKYNILEKDLYGSLGNEMSLTNLETGDLNNPGKLILIQVTDTSGILNFINKLSQTVNYSLGDTLFYEDYGNYKIRLLSIENFPSSVFGDLFSGFENTFYTIYKNYFVIGNNLETVENFIRDNEDENTWGKSVSFVQYFDNVQKKANLSLFVNLNRSYGIIYNSLDKRWKDFFRQYERQIRQFEILSIQYVNINHKTYSSLAIQHMVPTSTIDRPSEFLADQLVSVEAEISQKPFVVRNHVDHTMEVILEDTTGYLYLVSAAGNILWKKKFDFPDIHDIYQIDFYNNGKLQYLFNTRNSLQLIDRNGENVEKFPLNFGDSIHWEWLNVIDYDNSKKYRFIMSDEKGRLFLFDKHGKILEGWNGIETRGELVQEPFHIRIRGRDCFIAAGKSGIIHMFNRSGEEYPGFPYKFSSVLNSPIFIQPGPDFSRTILIAVMPDGELKKLNLEGKLTDSKQLYKQGNSSYFQIVSSPTGDNFIIARQDYNHVSLLTREGDPIFDQDILFSGRMKIQYYNFGVNNDIFALTDMQQEFTYLYNREGKLINNQPLESAFEVGIIYSENINRYKVYNCYGNQFRVSSFFRQ